ncbi:MAG: prepilin-type N-terminal cleavage/methylation domain-containing protein [Burkholderiales bacterium]|jgi:prepilin-type N-terminal cleavage/methylation domain-containing protein|nr:prepilin-type N-terminal cleavage/methylation domain-containing protein [Burkholderiales bacterium]
MKRHTPAQLGFTLVELSVVVAIVALLLGGLLVTLSASQEVRAYEETNRRLEQAREALVGFAVQYGRLPCPATATSGGREQFSTSPVGDASNGLCAVWDGYLPAADLGLGPADAGGFLIDAWGTGTDQKNRIRYAVADANTQAFTKTNGIRKVMLGDPKVAGATVDLSQLVLVCDSSANVAGAGPHQTCSGVRFHAAAAIYSWGKNASDAFSLGAGCGTGLTNPDERENCDGDFTLVSRPTSSTLNASDIYDDVVVWLPVPILYNRMIAAGAI